MSGARLDQAGLADPPRRGLWALGLFAGVLALLLLVSASADWYSREVSLPRYCDEPEDALARLETLRSGAPQSLDESRRDYMVAAKLEFILPRASGEPEALYRLRVLQALRKQCRQEGLLG